MRLAALRGTTVPPQGLDNPREKRDSSGGKSPPLAREVTCTACRLTPPGGTRSKRSGSNPSRGNPGPTNLPLTVNMSAMHINMSATVKNVQVMAPKSAAHSPNALANPLRTQGSAGYRTHTPSLTRPRSAPVCHVWRL